MSKLNDLMVYWVGRNWKTTLTGWASALFSLASALAIIAGANGAGASAYWIGIVAAIASAGAKMLNALVAADAQPSVDPKSGQTMPMTTGAIALVCMAAAGFIMLTCTGCATGGAKYVRVDATDDKVAGILPLPAAAKIAGRFSGDAEKWITQYHEIVQLASVWPQGLTLNGGLRLKGTEDTWLDPSLYEFVVWPDPIIKQFELPMPNYGPRVRTRPMVPSRTPSPAGTLPQPAPAPPAPAVAPAGDLLNGPVTGTVSP